LQPTSVAVQPTNDDTLQDYFFIKAEGKIYKILHSDLRYAEASGNYTKISTSNATLLPSMTFSSFLELLPAHRFLRVHRSFVVNKAKISHIEGNRVYIDSTEIPIGSNYREAFLNELGL
jgi:DNA-binding LytR/AlgR family response regulator